MSGLCVVVAAAVVVVAAVVGSTAVSTAVAADFHRLPYRALSLSLLQLQPERPRVRQHAVGCVEQRHPLLVAPLRCSLSGRTVLSIQRMTQGSGPVLLSYVSGPNVPFPTWGKFTKDPAHNLNQNIVGTPLYQFYDNPHMLYWRAAQNLETNAA